MTIDFSQRQTVRHIFEAPVEQTVSSHTLSKCYKSVTKNLFLLFIATLAVAIYFIQSVRDVSECECCLCIYRNVAKAWLIGASKQKHPEDSADMFTQLANPASVDLQQKGRLAPSSYCYFNFKEWLAEWTWLFDAKNNEVLCLHRSDMWLCSSD